MKVKLLVCSLISIALLSACSSDQSFSSSQAPLSSVCVDDVSTRPEAISEFKKQNGGYLYVWRNACGAPRCYLDAETFGDYGFELSLGKKTHISSEGTVYLSCTLEEMSSVLPETRYYQNGVYIGVFEIPFELGEGVTERIAANPYPYICKDKAIYERLGIGYCYEIAKTLGYVDRPSFDVLKVGKTVDADTLKEFVPLVLGDYAVATSDEDNLIFKSSSSDFVLQEKKSLSFFDEKKKDDVIGHSFEQMVETLGCPDYVNSGDGFQVDYLYKNDAFRYTLGERGNALTVLSLEKMDYAKAIHDHEPEKIAPISITQEVKEYMPIWKLVRRFGKPTGRLSGSSANFYVYHLDAGKLLYFKTLSSGLDYEKNTDIACFQVRVVSEEDVSGQRYVID